MYSIDSDQFVLPDTPQRVEPGDCLAKGCAEVFLLEPHNAEKSAVLDPEERILYLVGPWSRQDFGHLAGLLPRCTGIVLDSCPDSAALASLGATSLRKIRVFTRPRDLEISPHQHSNSRLIDSDTILSAGLDGAFRDELLGAERHSPVAATYFESQPLAFCYAASQTQRWWDVSVDTLPGHRRKGFAKQCALHLMSLMEAEGKQVVWQAFEDNAPSWKLAQSLGLIETACLWFCEREIP